MPLAVNDLVRITDPQDFNEGTTGLVKRKNGDKYVVGIQGEPSYYERQLTKIAGGKRRTRHKKNRKSRKSRRKFQK